MSQSEKSTIAAIATAPGTGAISLIRISGPDAFSITEEAAGLSTHQKHHRLARRCKIRDHQGNILDDGILTSFAGPKSFTGEDTVEFAGHGGLLVTKEVLSRFLECGAAHAAPGEFSQRAFLNGKLDLTQAEGIMDLISAQTKLAIRAAHSQLEGNLGKQTTAARDEVLAILAHLEAWIDFPEEDIDPQTTLQLRQRIETTQDTIGSLLSTADQGRILREGVRTVIFGEPNVGKSSLLNQLLGFDRAIVSDQAGTTRDTIEEVINLSGVPLRLVDTAGVRESQDLIENKGIERTVKQIESADLLLEIVDGSLPKATSSLTVPEGTSHLLLINKADLDEHPSWSETEAIRISCSEQRGFEALSEKIRNLLHLDEMDFGDHSVAINARHQDSLQRASASLDQALEQLTLDASSPELASIDLREALDALGEIPGKLDTEDLLGVIFSEFCIGK